MVGILLFKKDYKPEFESRCHFKVEEKITKTRERHTLEIAKVEENIRKSVCDCIAPHTNRDLDTVWKVMSEVSHAMTDAAKTVTGPIPGYEITGIIAPIPKSDFDRACPKKIERLKRQYTGKKAEEIDDAGKSICNCISENVLPFVGRRLPTFLTAMYDTKHSLRDEETIKKFEEKMILEAMKRRREI